MVGGKTYSFCSRSIQWMPNPSSASKRLPMPRIPILVGCFIGNEGQVGPCPLWSVFSRSILAASENRGDQSLPALDIVPYYNVQVDGGKENKVPHDQVMVPAALLLGFQQQLPHFCQKTDSG